MAYSLECEILKSNSKPKYGLPYLVYPNLSRHPESNSYNFEPSNNNSFPVIVSSLPCQFTYLLLFAKRSLGNFFSKAQSLLWAVF